MVVSGQSKVIALFVRVRVYHTRRSKKPIAKQLQVVTADRPAYSIVDHGSTAVELSIVSVSVIKVISGTCVTIDSSARIWTSFGDPIDDKKRTIFKKLN
jgi:hypothetical protein